MSTYVTYIRVSTQRQGRSGLGLEAQRQVLADYTKRQGATVLEEYVEVESGAHADRQALTAAMAMAKKAKAVVLVAKLDRLSRSSAFIGNLMEKRVRFEVAELGPDVDPFMLHIYAAVAEKERALISARTKAALGAKRARGERLGGDIDKARAAWAAKCNVAMGPARTLASELYDDGMTLAEVGLELQRRGVLTARGVKVWSPTQVRRLLA